MLYMTMEETLTFGDVVRQYRKRAQLTQEELADKMNVSRGTISQIENGFIQRPKKHQLQALERVLGLSVRYAWELIGDVDSSVEEEDPATLFQRIAALPDPESRMQAYSELPEPVRHAVERLMLDRMNQLMQQLAASTAQQVGRGDSK